MKIPYIEISTHGIMFSLYNTKVKGCTLRCDKLKKIYKNV